MFEIDMGNSIHQLSYLVLFQEVTLSPFTLPVYKWDKFDDPIFCTSILPRFIKFT